MIQKIIAFIVAVTVFGILHSSAGYEIQVDAVAEDCYFDRVETGAKISLIYEVVDGGFLDIDLIVTKPSGEELFSRKGDSSAKVAFTASEPGAYTYCFSNRMSTVTPKTVKFSIEISNAEKPISDFGDYTSKEREEIQPEKLERMIRELRSAIHGISQEQEYVEVRDMIHGRIKESTNYRVTFWVLFESVLVVVVSVTQIVYIKKFFEVRRMV